MRVYIYQKIIIFFGYFIVLPLMISCASKVDKIAAEKLAADKYWQIEDEKRIQEIKQLIAKGRSYAAVNNFSASCEALRTADFYGLEKEKPTNNRKIYVVDPDAYNLFIEVCKKSKEIITKNYVREKIGKADVANNSNDLETACRNLSDLIKPQDTLDEARRAKANFDKYKEDTCAKNDANKILVDAKNKFAVNKYMVTCDALQNSYKIYPSLYLVGSDNFKYKKEICDRGDKDAKRVLDLKAQIEKNKNNEQWVALCDAGTELDRLLPNFSETKKNMCNAKNILAQNKYLSSQCQRIFPARQACATSAGTLFQYSACMKIKYGEEFSERIESECVKADSVLKGLR